MEQLMTMPFSGLSNSDLIELKVEVGELLDDCHDAN
jgi:hypothetical protein